MLQRNLPEEVKARRKSDYKDWKKRARELIDESKRRVDEEFGRKLSQNFSENKQLFWREVRKVRGGEKSGDVRMRGEDGELVGGESELKEIFIYLSIPPTPRPLPGTSPMRVATAELSPGLPVQALSLSTFHTSTTRSLSPVLFHSVYPLLW